MKNFTEFKRLHLFKYRKKYTWLSYKEIISAMKGDWFRLRLKKKNKWV